MQPSSGGFLMKCNRCGLEMRWSLYMWDCECGQAYMEEFGWAIKEAKSDGESE